jgi:hypothetical protein
MNLRDCCMVMRAVIRQGGLAPGGLNFDCKVRLLLPVLLPAVDGCLCDLHGSSVQCRAVEGVGFFSCRVALFLVLSLILYPLPRK